MIDLGTGTGILAIAAAKLGARSVLAIDNDAESIRIATENITTNGVKDKIQVELGSLPQILSGDFGITQAGLVVANILSNVVVNLFDEGFSRTTAPEGLFILSGILRTQTPQIRACLQRHLIKQISQEQLGDWVCILAQKE